jgi:hypothetical protein
MAAKRLSVSLIPGPTEQNIAKENRDKWRDELREAFTALQSQHPKFYSRRTGAHYIQVTSFVVDIVIPLAQMAAPTLGVVLVAWLRGRSGRVVRLKFDGVEAVARTAEEIDELLKRAAEFRDKQKNTRKDRQ